MPTLTKRLKDLFSWKAHDEDNEDNPAENSVLDSDEKRAVGPLILFDNTTGDASGIDLVFVHGLRGCRLRTWSTNDGFCWPKELLEEDMENVRVITWGYDASIAHLFKQASQESIFGHGNTLLDDLARVRHGITRSIVFVCHGLGGLVAKEALIKSVLYRTHDRHPSLASISLCTVGVVFFGTPHRGSEKESYGEIVAKVAKFALRQPNEQLLGMLNPDSHTLSNQRDQFTTISKNMTIFCVKAELSTPIGMIVPERSAVYDGFNVRQGSIHANHMEMTRFAGRDVGYERVLNYLREVCRVATDSRPINLGPAVSRISRGRIQLMVEDLEPAGTSSRNIIPTVYSDA